MNFNHHMILLIILVVCSLNISCNSYSLADAEKRTINYLKRKPSNLVAYWDFDEGSGSTVTDQSGNGNDGTVTGATWVTGKNGSALLFSDSATGDYVQVADSNSLDPSTALTIEAWIKADTFDGDGATSGNIIISKWVDWSIGKAQFLLTAFTGGGLAFKINGVQARHDLRVENQLSEGVWHHILATWNEHDIILAVDGEIVAHESSLVTSMYSTEYDQDHLRIGYLSDSTYIGAKKWQFKGVIDEVSIYHDFYDDFHNINPPEVLYPDGGEVLRGRTTIQWTAATDLLNHSVTYDVSYATDRGGYYWTVIASGLTGTTYQWDTTTVANGSLYLIKVKAICTAGSNAQDESDSFFTIQNPKHTLPAPTISYPNGGETLDGAVPIQWTSAVDTCTWNHSVSYNLYYSPNNGATWSLLAFNLSGNNYPWNTSTVLNGEYYLIRVVATCLEGITSSDISDSSFAVYNWIPQIRLSNLINNTAHQPHTLISFNITDDAGISSVSYHWDDASTNSTFNASYTVSLPSSNGSHILHVYANNTLNHWAYRCFVFITDIDAPIISLESLQNGTYQQPATPIYLTVIDDFMVKSVRYNWDGASYTTFSTSYVALLPSIIGQHFLRVYANDTAGNWATALFMFFSDDGTLDSDTDDLCDLWELENGLNPYDDDTDDDGITDGVEVMFNLDPLNPDTDGDGLSDGAEVNTWDTLPMVADTDNDGINDGREIELGLDPNKPDTDGDGDLDGVELEQILLDPKNPGFNTKTRLIIFFVASVFFLGSLVGVIYQFVYAPRRKRIRERSRQLIKRIIAPQLGEKEKIEDILQCLSSDVEKSRRSTYRFCLSVFDEKEGPIPIFYPALSQKEATQIVFQTLVLGGGSIDTPEFKSQLLSKKKAIFPLESLNKAAFLYLFILDPKNPEKFRGGKILGTLTLITDLGNQSQLYEDSAILSSLLDELLEKVTPVLRESCLESDLMNVDFSAVQAFLASYKLS